MIILHVHSLYFSLMFWYHLTTLTDSRHPLSFTFKVIVIWGLRLEVSTDMYLKCYCKWVNKIKVPLFYSAHLIFSSLILFLHRASFLISKWEYYLFQSNLFLIKSNQYIYKYLITIAKSWQTLSSLNNSWIVFCCNVLYKFAFMWILST
jgi:hypothetical protein